MRVSVIIPVFNGEAFLAQTLRSVLNQTRRPDEVIVVDNGSSDRSVEIAQGFGGIVRTISAPGGGASAARNAGVREATGDAIMFLDADDLLGPTVIEELAAVLERRPGTVACCPWMRFELVGESWLAAPASCAPRRNGHDDLQAWLTGWYHPPCALLWSRAAYEASGGWDPEIKVNTDGDIMMRALIAGVELAPTAGGTAYYRRLPGDAVSLSGKRFTRTGLESRLAVLDRVADRLGEAGRIARYRAALAEAYDGLVRDAGGFPDLRSRALAAATTHGGPEKLRRLRRRLERVTDRARRSMRPPALPPVAARGVSPDRAEPGPERPLVSIIVPTYNRAHLLPRAVGGVLAQTYDRFELLIIDDCSTDNTAEVVEGFGDARIRYIRQPKNGGVSAARNRGLREAKGELIAFLDSDDEWVPEKLARQVDLVRRRPDKVGLFYTGVLTYGAEGDRQIEVPVHRGDVWREMLHRNAIHGTSSTMLRREVVEMVGYFDETLPAIEDFDYWTRIARFYEFDFVPDALTIYHNEDQDESAELERRSRNFPANMAARHAYAQRYAPEAKREGVRHLFLLETARRQLRSPVGDSRAAVKALLRAIKNRPAEPRLYMWLLFALLPRGPREAMGPAIKSFRERVVPQRLWFGAGQA